MAGAADRRVAEGAVLFSGLPRDLCDLLIDGASTRRFSRGETIFLQGDAALCVFVVLEGWVKLFRLTPTGAEAVVGVFTRGRSFGEAVAFRGDVYPVSAEAVTDARLLEVRAGAMLSLMKERPEICFAILGATYRHLHSLVEQIEQLKAHTGAQRVAEFLLSLCPVEQGACAITLPYDKTLIAGRLGMQPQSLSRAFARLRRRGVLIHQNQAAIADVEALKDYVLEDRGAPWSKAQ